MPRNRIENAVERTTERREQPAIDEAELTKAIGVLLVRHIDTRGINMILWNAAKALQLGQASAAQHLYGEALILAEDEEWIWLLMAAREGLKNQGTPFFMADPTKVVGYYYG